ncbi:VQ motif-containing protein 9-like [Bidens hawaiensis]|uniref:VQ motif-containing protein 9-like n=1 Tax=Bidens hawaiensis TaxID=980011 RepID=UPI00404B2DBD
MMDNNNNNKSCHSTSEESSATNPNNNNKDQYLKQIHKLSHKISKPQFRKPFEFENPLHQFHHHQPLDESQPSNLQHNQPPVYNVSKSDFRDVVQKLTGSPAHERLPPPVNAAVNAAVFPPVKPQSSRLQKIRPPPLNNIGLRQPSTAVVPPYAVVAPPSNPNVNFPHGNFYAGHRPLSLLPPLPAVDAAAEWPISAYMRCFQTNVAGFPPPAPLMPEFTAPASPLAFGCLPPTLSPRFPFSPTNEFGFQQLMPLSPTPPVPSPRWKQYD